MLMFSAGEAGKQRQRLTFKQSTADLSSICHTVYSALNLLGLYHDSILVRLLSPTPIPRSLGPPSRTSAHLDKALPQPSSSTPAPPATFSKLQHTPSTHARYTHHFSDAKSAYNIVARTLVIVSYTELLTEMVARRRLGQKKAWDVVVGVESVK
jgi:peroxin-16